MHETKSPLARLVLFMIALAVAGSVFAGIHYYAVDLPQQKDARAPSNLDARGIMVCIEDCMIKNCGYDHAACPFPSNVQQRVRCQGICGSG
ncbi:hypothetical protein [Methanoregula sp.]|uniref:hypothetical protein n=1 Tax=Methanoregula sp. TaxID=2052170 RepID=UPI000CB8D196|nr:hypothetical protein [Methanoregula sp.]PKG32629.1 MAG: hypothetical protein CW742_07145 [Methanoregula sp.]